MKTFTTTNLVGHLRKHPSEYKQYEDEKAAANDAAVNEQACRSRSNQKQLTLEESDSRSRIWDINNPRAARVSRKIGEMIALDSQPMSIVDDVGFVRLLQTIEPRYSIPSRKYITDTVLPRIHSDVLEKVKNELEEARWISCTSDIWSTEVSHDSLISLTAHWVTNQFERKSIMLQAASLPGSHTADAIRRKYLEMFDKWEIEDSQLHCFVVDNAANMKKAMKDGGYTYQGCFAHTLQLVINDGILSQVTTICERYSSSMSPDCRPF